MKNRVKKIGYVVEAAVVILIGIIIARTSLAHDGGYWGNRGDHKWSNSGIPEVYQLTSDQITKMDDIRSEFNPKINSLENDLWNLKVEYQGYANRSDAESGKIKSYRKQIRDLEGKVEDLRLDMTSEINKILNDTQKVYFGSNYTWWDTDCDMMGYMSASATHSGMSHCGCCR